MWFCVLQSPDFHTMSSWENPVVPEDCMICEAGKLFLKPFFMRVTC